MEWLVLRMKYSHKLCARGSLSYDSAQRHLLQEAFPECPHPLWAPMAPQCLLNIITFIKFVLWRAEVLNSGHFKFRIMGKAFKINPLLGPTPRIPIQLIQGAVDPRWSLGMVCLFVLFSNLCLPVCLSPPICKSLKNKGCVLVTSMCPDPSTQY